MVEEKPHKITLSEDGIVKFDFMTRLENIVMANIVSNLWMSNDTLQDIINFIHSGMISLSEYWECSESWKKISDTVEAKVEVLPLPQFITSNLSNVVPVLGYSILDWIRHHECILNCHEYSAVDQIRHITWTARGKVDYAQTAKNILSDKDTRLSDDHKLKLACIYCLEDEIAAIVPNVVHGNYLETVQISVHPMVCYWSAQITGDETKLYEHGRASLYSSIEEYIIQLLIESDKSGKSFNEVAIKYMWEKLSDDRRAEKIIPLIKELHNQELKYTLLSHLDFQKQQEVFKEYADAVLLGMLDDWLWRDNFLPTALRTLDVMQPSVYLTILSEIFERLTKNSTEENIFIFKQLWQNGARNFKEERSKIFEQDYLEYSSLKGLVFSSSWEQNLDVFGLIINSLRVSVRRKRDIILGFIEHLVCLIKNAQWDLLKRLSCTLSEEDTRLKKRLIERRGLEIGKYFLEQGSLDEMEYFMSWACDSVEESDEFRKRFIDMKTEGALNAVVTSNEMDLTNLEDHIYWCANENLEVMNQFKSKIPTRYYCSHIENLILEGRYELLDKFLRWCFMNNVKGINKIKVEILKSRSSDLILKLIDEDNYERLDEILNWCFLGDQLRISQFKSIMCYTYPGYFYIDLSVSLIRKDSSFKMLDKFVTWAFADPIELQEFKTWLLYCPEQSAYLSIICTEFLLNNQFDVADKCIDWCVKSPGDFKKFKKMLMFSSDFISFCHNYRDRIDVPSLIKWINPSKEIIEAFKIRYLQEDYVRDNFIKLLDEFLQSDSDWLQKCEENSTD